MYSSLENIRAEERSVFVCAIWLSFLYLFSAKVSSILLSNRQYQELQNNSIAMVTKWK
jgi:hypothetical protein